MRNDHFYSRFTVALAILANSLVANNALAGPITAESVMQEWKHREDQVQSLRIKWSVAETRAKKYVGMLSGDDYYVSDKDITLSATRTLTLQGTHFRLEHDGQMWWTKTKSLDPFVDITTYDGNQYAHTYVKCSIANNPQTTLSPSHARDRLFGARDTAAIWYSFRGSILSGLHLGIDSFHPTGRRVMINDRPCHEFAKVSNSSTKKQQFFIDAERAGLVLRRLDTENGKALAQIDVSYSPHPELGWVPSAWEYVLRARKSGDLMLMIKCKVLELAINPEVDSSLFKPVFLPRSRVIDVSNGDEVQYGILPDGTKGREVKPSGQPILLSDLMQEPHRRTRSWMFWTIAAFSGMALVLAIRFWFKRRSAGTPAAS